MRPFRRLRFRPESVDAGRPTLIDRYLGRDDHANRGSWTPAPVAGLSEVSASLIDTTGMTDEIPLLDDAATIWHLIWVRGDGSSRVTIGLGAGAVTWPVAPGDSVVVPPGMALRASSGQLAIAVALPGRHAPLAPPTHGEEQYFGYNRQTLCCRVGDARLCRWKLTQPLPLAQHHPAPALVLALARASVFRTTNGIDQLRQGELAVINPAADPVAAPDGLSYLLTIDRIELESSDSDIG